MKVEKVAIGFLIVLVSLALMGAGGCEADSTQVSKSGATQTKVFPRVFKNSKGRTVEQQNIWDRIEVTTDPSKVLWIHLIALDGNIIKRMPVRCKVTSGGKRLEPTTAADGLGDYPDSGFGYGETTELIQPDGTYGNSDPYIYWFDPMGRYHQWGTAGGLGYLLTDYPINLEDPIDKITGLYNVHQQAAKWQEEQEAILRKKEEGGKK